MNRLYVALILVAATVGSSHAGLVVLGAPIDGQRALDITWGWNPEAPDTSSPNLQNWIVTPWISFSGTWDVQVDVRHLSDPHPFLIEFGGGQPETFNHSFLTNQFGLLGSFNSTVDHGPVHQDNYAYTFDRS